MHTPQRELAVIIGSGPNGLAAALTLAEAGHSVQVLEKHSTLGGGLRSWRDEYGVLHDHCAAIMPLALASPFFRHWQEQLSAAGLQWAFGKAEVAHALPEELGGSIAHFRNLEATIAQFTPADARAWQRHFAPLLPISQRLFDGLLSPLPPPRSSWSTMLRFGIRGIQSATGLASQLFSSPAVRGLFAGHAAHSIQPLERPATAGFGTMLALSAHAVGWPCAIGGSQALAAALIQLCRQRGVQFETQREVHSLNELPRNATIFFDTGPQAMARIAGDELPSQFRNRLNRFRYGPGVYKLDITLNAPIPWRDAACRQAPTVHLGATLEAIAQSEKNCWRNRAPARPFVLISQQSLFDPSRQGRQGEHNLWAYCHVPPGWAGDATEAILQQIESAAPGFRDQILQIHRSGVNRLESENPNLVGGDITGGVQDLVQQYARPVLALNPYKTPNPRLRLCSASTPPGGGIHGMCGWWAAHESRLKWRQSLTWANRSRRNLMR